MTKTFIYGLFDPRQPDSICYVGKANSPRLRLQTHIVAARRPVRTFQNARLCRWIRTMLQEGYRPQVRILEVVSLIVWAAAERRWITATRTQNPALFNVSAGGNGGVLGSAETRQKQSLAHTGKRLPQYQRAKIRATLLGVKHSPERIEANRRGHLGLKLTPVQREARKGNHYSRGHRVNPHSIEVLVAATAQIMNDPQRRKDFLQKRGAAISIGQTKAWARRKAAQLP